MGIPKQGPVIAIDGPAGTGKSTVTRHLAQALGFIYIDTGALYRAVAFACSKAGVDLGQSDRAAQIAHEAHLEFRRDPDQVPQNRVFLNGIDVSDRIRTLEVSMAASRVSAIPGVRAALLGLQRRLGCVGHAILEGRDIGTVIFPDAEVKFFLTASVEERTRRRFEELKRVGKSALPSWEELRRQIQQRDYDDTHRPLAPLRKAEDAVEMDTTGLTLEEVVSKMELISRERLP